MGNGLAEVIDALAIPYVIGIGEGAGANILARFGMDHPEKCLGLILIHCTSTQAGVMEFFRDKVSNVLFLFIYLDCVNVDYLLFSPHSSVRNPV